MKGSKAEPLFAAILPLFYVAWTIYPVAYIMPIFNGSVEIFALAIVAQQVLYTIADVTSKIFYGVMLNVSSTRLSVEQGYKPSN
jgi:bacteriorhodopsin